MLIPAGVVGVRFPGVDELFPIIAGALPAPDFAIPPFATPLGYNTLFVRTLFSCTIVSSMLLNADAPRSADNFSCTKRASANNLWPPKRENISGENNKECATWRTTLSLRDLAGQSADTPLPVGG